MSYTMQWLLSIGITVLLAGAGSIAAIGGDALGLSIRAMSWLGVGTAMLSVLASFLPRVTANPTDARKGLD